MFINLHLLVCRISNQGRRLRAGQPGKLSSFPREGPGILLSAVEPTQLPIQWVPGLYCETKAAGT